MPTPISISDSKTHSPTIPKKKKKIQNQITHKQINSKTQNSIIQSNKTRPLLLTSLPPRRLLNLRPKAHPRNLKLSKRRGTQWENRNIFFGIRVYKPNRLAAVGSTLIWSSAPRSRLHEKSENGNSLSLFLLVFIFYCGFPEAERSIGFCTVCV
jgi:hypothetical protein